MNRQSPGQSPATRPHGLLPDPFRRQDPPPGRPNRPDHRQSPGPAGFPLHPSAGLERLAPGSTGTKSYP